MTNHAKAVALDGLGLKFTRIMAGEYFCDTEHGRYTAWQTTFDCRAPRCNHEHTGWALTANGWAIGALYRTLTDAIIAATKHYEEQK